jgi:hypothetical protein
MAIDYARLDAMPVDRRVVAAGCAGALFAALLIGILGYGAGQLGPTSVGAFTTSYHNRVLDDPLELLLVQSDGQAFASLARDPLLARPEVFRTDAEAAYRAQRPLLPYAAWALSFGRSGWVPPALALLAAAGTGLAVAGVAQLLIERRAPAKWSLLVLLFPGTYAALSYCGPEPLGCGLAIWGLVAWSKRRMVPALVLFALGGLCRETLLLVPAALLLVALRHRRMREFIGLASTFLPYVLWVGIVRLRVGALPTDAGRGRLGAPFTGMIDGLSIATGETVAYAAICLAIGACALALARRDPLCIVVAVNLAFATVMGSEVWINWPFFGRVFLPLDALALVVIVGKVLGAPPVDTRTTPSPTQARRLASAPRQGLTGVVGPGAASGGAAK